MDYLANYNYSIATLKPIASGLIDSEYGLINEDVYHLLKANKYISNISQINQFSFKYPIAPHIAAKKENIKLNVQTIISKLNPIIRKLSYINTILIEGVGGLMVPLNETETYLDLISTWGFPVIIVVGLKLGCLNHALLTLRTLESSGINVLGWVANQIDYQMEAYEDNLNFLITKLSIPCLATISYNGQLQPSKHFMDIFICR